MKAEIQALCAKSSLPEIRKFLETQLGLMNVGDPIGHQLVLAIDEACANAIIHHHHCDGTSQISVSIFREGDELRIELKDAGDPFPLNEMNMETDLDEIVRRRSKGGLGLILINRIMDKVEVIKGEKEFTYRFTKYIESSF